MARDSAFTASPASPNIGGVGSDGPTSQAPEDAALGPNAGPLLPGAAGRAPARRAQDGRRHHYRRRPSPFSCANAAPPTASATARTNAAIQNFANFAKVVVRTEASSSNATAA